MSASIIGKIILWIFVAFAIGLVGYFFYLFILQAQRTFGNKSKISTTDDKVIDGVYCSKCGVGNLKENKFCRGCGKELK